MSEKDFKINTGFIAGLISGSINKFISHPLDTIKTRIQIRVNLVDKNYFLKDRIILNTIKNILKNEGIKGFYKGVGISTIMGAPASCLFFGSYEYFKNIFSKNMKSKELSNFSAGMMAEVVSCILWLPIDIIKERLQVQSELKTFKYNNSIDALKQILKKEKIYGLYRAYGATVLSFGPTLGINLMVYEKLKSYLFENKEMNLLQNFSIGFISSFVGSLIINPLDLAKIRMQIQRVELIQLTHNNKINLEEGRFGYKNVFHGLYKIVKEENFLSLWRGCGIRIIFFSFSSAVNLTIFEKIKYKIQNLAK